MKDLDEYTNFVHIKEGYCYYTIEPNKKPFIFGLFVEPEYRLHGFAKKLLDYVIDEIRNTGYIGLIEIEAKPKESFVNIKRLIAFYKSKGLEVIL